MQRIDKFTILHLSVAGFKCFMEERQFDFGPVSFVTGANHAGKSSIADAIAFAITGQDRFGVVHIDKLYCEALPDIQVRIYLKDGTDSPHELVRTRRRDKMQITWDGYTIRQSDLSELFGERDEFLSIFNPLYFIEVLGSDGQGLLQKNLPLIDHQAVLKKLCEPDRKLLENVSLLSPDTFIQMTREEVRELEEGIIMLEGQSVQILRQREENRQALTQAREKLERIQSSIDALEKKKAEGMDFKTLEVQITELRLRYDELLGDKPKGPPPELDEQIRQAQLALERLQVKTYESKYTAALAETQAALKAAAAEHGQVTAMLGNVQPGATCPTCKRPFPMDALAHAQQGFQKKLGEIIARGQNLRVQFLDLQKLDADSLATFERFRKDDIEKTTAHLNQLQALRDKMELEVREHETLLNELAGQIQSLDADLTMGNLDAEEIQALSSLYASKQDAENEFAALEAVCNRPEPDISARTEETKKLIQEKKILMGAAVNYLAARNELAFAGLSMPHVKISLYDLIKTTGELKNAFRFQYNGRDYRRLSHSEKLKAGLEVSEMMKRLTGRRYPVFIDDVESITSLPKLPDQILLARVAPDQPLSVVIPGRTTPAPLKKAS